MKTIEHQMTFEWVIVEVSSIISRDKSNWFLLSNNRSNISEEMNDIQQHSFQLFITFSNVEFVCLQQSNEHISEESIQSVFDSNISRLSKKIQLIWFEKKRSHHWCSHWTNRSLYYFVFLSINFFSSLFDRWLCRQEIFQNKIQCANQ